MSEETLANHYKINLSTDNYQLNCWQHQESNSSTIPRELYTKSLSVNPAPSYACNLSFGNTIILWIGLNSLNQSNDCVPLSVLVSKIEAAWSGWVATRTMTNWTDFLTHTNKQGSTHKTNGLKKTIDFVSKPCLLWYQTILLMQKLSNLSRAKFTSLCLIA